MALKNGSLVAAGSRLQLVVPARPSGAAHAVLIMAVWALLWVWLFAGVLAPLSRIPAGTDVERAASVEQRA